MLAQLVRQYGDFDRCEDAVSRAKRTIARIGLKLAESGDEWPNRCASVLSVLYLIFKEGRVRPFHRAVAVAGPS